MRIKKPLIELFCPILTWHLTVVHAAVCISLISNITHMNFEGESQDLTKCRVNHYHKQS